MKDRMKLIFIRLAGKIIDILRWLLVSYRKEGMMKDKSGLTFWMVGWLFTVGFVDLTKYLNKLDWVICGYESGSGARSMMETGLFEATTVGLQIIESFFTFAAWPLILGITVHEIVFK